MVAVRWLFKTRHAKVFVVPKLKDNKQERTHEVCESRKSTHNLLIKMNITIM